MPFQNDIFPNLTPPVPGAVLLEVYVYGEGQTNDKVKNLRGQLYQHKDGGGLQQINSYDFKGNVRQTQQQLLDDATLTDVDWGASPVLSTETFTSSVTYDALNRPVTQTDPGSNIQAFTYDKGGLLKTVTLNNDDYVNDIHYDAKGQRQAIWYGNGTKTSYTYDPDTFRLRRLLTVNLSTNAQLQDLNYYYDPVGNITTIRDDAQQTLFFNNSVVSPTQAFTYDALYRLITATGRELKGTASFGSEDNWNDAPWMGQPQPGNGSVVQNYTQQYTYDAVGNILSLQHTAGTGSYTRTYDVDMASNKLLSTTVGSNTYHYTHDARGNMLTMPHLQNMAWNAQNELNSITPGSNNTYYQYSNGQRVRKYTDKGIIKEERIYLGSYEIYRKFDQASSLIIERTTVHISDDTGRIAMLEKRTYGTAADDNNTAAMLTRYIYSNHLQSVALELDASAAVISYEEYHPYGTTAYQANNAAIKAVAKRYRYTGKERDEESGLYYHGARYYIPWLCHWASVDPLESKFAGRTPYCYSADNPVIFNDPSGSQEIKTITNIPKDSTQNNGQGHVTIYDIAVAGGRDIEPSPGTSISESKFNADGKEYEISAIFENSFNDQSVKVVGYYVYDKWLSSDERLEQDKYYGPVFILKTKADLKEFISHSDEYLNAGRGFYFHGRPPEGQIKMAAGLEYGDAGLVREGLADEWRRALKNPFFWLQIAGGIEAAESRSLTVGNKVEGLTMSSSVEELTIGGMAAKTATQAEKGVFIVTREGVVLPKGAKIPSQFIENPYRSSSYGLMENGKFVEKLRIDPATPPGMKGPNFSHYHLNGSGKHSTGNWPWWAD